MSVNFFGDFKNSTISCSSSFSSSTPATSLNVIFALSVVPITFALLFPKVIVLFPFPCEFPIIKNQKINRTITIANGDNKLRTVINIDCVFSSSVNVLFIKSSFIAVIKASRLGILTSFSTLEFFIFTYAFFPFEDSSIFSTLVFSISFISSS